jgi:hypothetical protein
MDARAHPDERLEFTVRSLDAIVDDGIPLVVNGHALRSGRIAVRLDPDAPAASDGVLDYAHGTADVTFRLLLDFPEMREALRAAGLEEEEVPVARGLLHSTGDILPDHSFSLSGSVTLAAHELFRAEDLDAGVLPGT